VAESVLFVVHDFPPAGGSGANRALAFCRYLPAHGWRPLGLEAVRTRSLEPRQRPFSKRADGLGRLGAHARSGGVPPVWKTHLAHARRFPDAQRGWLPFAIPAGLRAIRRRRPRLLYSTAGPFTSHLVALALHRLTGLPWVAELRDGWYRWNQSVFPDYPAWRGALESRLERLVITHATRVVLLTELMAQAFRRQYARLPADHFVHIPNGFDPAQLEGLPALPRQPGFTVLHAGALYYGRSLAAFLQAAACLPDLHLVLLGTLDQTARAELGQTRVEYLGQRDHRAALAHMRAADLLLLIVNTTPGAEAAVPGKLYEYLAVGRPILAITPPGAAAAEIVRRTRAGWTAPAGDADAILAQLQAARSAVGVHPDRGEIARYDRRRLTADLARLFDACCA
jgi:glycosyltransferase involved in cell wall biosynthesis